MFCVFLRIKVPHSLIKNATISSSDSPERFFLFRYCPSSLVSRQIYHRSTSFRSKYAIESKVYYPHLPNMVSVIWLWRIGRGIGTNCNQKGRNILSKWECYLSGSIVFPNLYGHFIRFRPRTGKSVRKVILISFNGSILYARCPVESNNFPLKCTLKFMFL